MIRRHTLTQHAGAFNYVGMCTWVCPYFHVLINAEMNWPSVHECHSRKESVKIYKKASNEDFAESDTDFVARLPPSVRNNYSCLVGRKDILSVLKTMFPPPCGML